MSEKEQLNSAQLAARSSWRLVIVTICFANFANRVPVIGGYLGWDFRIILIGTIVMGLLALASLVLGTVCGIVSLCGISRAGTHKVLWPGLIGTVLNGLVLVLLITSFIKGFKQGRQAALQRQGLAAPQVQEVQARTLPPTKRISSTSHLGTWQTTTPKGEPMTWIFSPTQFTLVNAKGSNSFPYEIDYTMNPIWLTVRADPPRQSSMLMMLQFFGNNKMQVQGSNPGSTARPVDFGTEPSDILLFDKRP